ncbi:MULTISPECIES: hypothetical protein [Actinomycetes]|uniref:hypothetical protein n=1 Tax=Actinomycetes TaxID=1760 RepID=UPI00131A44E7|nr:MULTISPECIES: hypothetical protein [Actinomycetes]
MLVEILLRDLVVLVDFRFGVGGPPEPCLVQERPVRRSLGIGRSAAFSWSNPYARSLAFCEFAVNMCDAACDTSASGLIRACAASAPPPVQEIPCPTSAAGRGR